MYNWGTSGQGIRVNPERDPDAGKPKRSSVLGVYMMKTAQASL